MTARAFVGVCFAGSILMIAVGFKILLEDDIERAIRRARRARQRRLKR